MALPNTVRLSAFSSRCSLSDPTDRLDRASIDRLLTIAGPTLIGADNGRFFIVPQFEHPWTDLYAMTASDTEIRINHRFFHKHLLIYGRHFRIPIRA